MRRKHDSHIRRPSLGIGDNKTDAASISRTTLPTMVYISPFCLFPFVVLNREAALGQHWLLLYFTIELYCIIKYSSSLCFFRKYVYSCRYLYCKRLLISSLMKIWGIEKTSGIMNSQIEHYILDDTYIVVYGNKWYLIIITPAVQSIDPHTGRSCLDYLYAISVSKAHRYLSIWIIVIYLCGSSCYCDLGQWFLKTVPP